MANHSLYEQDFIAWVKQQVQLLQTRSFDQLDLENLAEEVECLIHQYQDFVKHHAAPKNRQSRSRIFSKRAIYTG